MTPANEPAPDAPRPRRRFADVAGCYLPRRFRRWFVYLPLGALLLTTLLALGVAVYALRVDGAPYFEAGHPPDVASQFTHLEGVLGEGSASSPPDVVRGYSKLCGYSTEWRPIFYMFHAMCLAERAATEPATREDAIAQLTRCARGVLRVPDEVTTTAALREHLEQREYDSAPIQTGYEAVVLGLRHQVAGDDLFDPAIARGADALAAWLERCIAGDSPESFWTSDHAVQVYGLWLADRALGTDRSALLARWEATLRARFLDADGLLCSEVTTHPDGVVTPPCGSSIAWTVLFLVDALPALSRDQYDAFCRHRERRLLTLSAANEHASSWELGDTNSGPLILGFSPAATGFALCAHKLHGDRERFTRSLRVFELFGQPGPTAAGHLHYHLGNAMGDAILLYAKVARPRR